jgi:hypothetical protein
MANALLDMDKVDALFLHSELSSIYHAIIACTIDISWQHFCWGNAVLLVWTHRAHVLRWLQNLEIWGFPWPNRRAPVSRG